MSEELYFKPKEVVIKEGDMGQGFFILGTGILDVYKGDVLVATLDDPPTTFGEMSDILGEKRSCSIVARTECHVMYIPDGVDKIIDENPQLAKQLLRNLAARLAETTRKLTAAENHLLWSVKQHPNRKLDE